MDSMLPTGLSGLSGLADSAKGLAGKASSSISAATSGVKAASSDNVSVGEKKNAVLQEYCKIVTDANKKGEIKKSFDESLKIFLDDLGKNKINKEQLEDFIVKIIFSQIQTSIVEDYHVQHSLVRSMLEDDNKELDPILSEAMESFKCEDGVGTNTNRAFDILVGKLKSDRMSGGATPTKMDEILNWYRLDTSPEVVNEKIFYIIKTAVEKALDNDSSRKMIYTEVTEKIEKRVSEVLKQMSEKGDIHLKKHMLHAILTSTETRGLARTFKAAIRKAVEEANKDCGSNPDSKPNINKMKETVLHYFQPNPPEVIDSKKGIVIKGKGGRRRNKTKISKKKLKNKRTLKHTK
jgi:hypothetical protein